MSVATPPAKMSLTDALDSLPDATRAKVVKAAHDMKAADAAPSMKLSMNGQTLTISFDCDSVEIATLLQMVDIGSTDGDFHTGLVGQIASLGAQGQAVSNENANFVLSVVRSIKPRDELEAMLATQMGGYPYRDHDAGKTVEPCAVIAATGRSRARLEQAGPHLHHADGLLEAIPHRRATEGHG